MVKKNTKDRIWHCKSFGGLETNGIKMEQNALALFIKSYVKTIKRMHQQCWQGNAQVLSSILQNR